MYKKRVAVVLLPGESDGYVAFIPLFPDCTTQGGTVEEALKNAKESLELALEDRREDDLERLGYIDVDHVVVGQIQVEVPAPAPAPARVR